MRDWWTASLTKVKATQTCLFQTPSYLREATWSQCPKLTTIWLFSEGVYRRSLADWLTADVGPRAVGLNSPRCRTPKSSRDLVSISEILHETMLARNFYQSESRWFDIWEPAFTEFYFRLHRRRTNVYFIKISACHNIIFILRTIQDQGRKVCTV